MDFVLNIISVSNGYCVCGIDYMQPYSLPLKMMR